MKLSSLEEKEREMTTAAHRVLSQKPEPAILNDSRMRDIVRVAQVVARGRTGVRRDRYTREPDIVRPEYAVRLSKQLADLVIGIAMAREKTTVGKEEIRLVQQTAIHSLELKRIFILNILLSEHC